MKQLFIILLSTLRGCIYVMTVSKKNVYMIMSNKDMVEFVLDFCNTGYFNRQ